MSKGGLLSSFARFSRFPFQSFHCAIGVTRYISCIDSETGAVLTMSEHGLKDTGKEFHAWLEDWISGVDLWKRLVVLEDKVIVNPFTKQAQTVKVVAGTTGTPSFRRIIGDKPCRRRQRSPNWMAPRRHYDARQNSRDVHTQTRL